MVESLNQPTSSAIKEGDTVLYTPTAEGEKEVRAKVIKVHPDAGGPHYTILPHVKDAKEKNTTAERISKVGVRQKVRLCVRDLAVGSRQHTSGS